MGMPKPEGPKYNKDMGWWAIMYLLCLRGRAREKPQQEEDWVWSRIPGEEQEYTHHSMRERGSIDHSLCFSTGLLQLLKVLQDDVI